MKGCLHFVILAAIEQGPLILDKQHCNLEVAVFDGQMQGRVTIDIGLVDIDVRIAQTLQHMLL